jgi:hypothetical protein
MVKKTKIKIKGVNGKEGILKWHEKEPGLGVYCLLHTYGERIYGMVLTLDVGYHSFALVETIKPVAVGGKPVHMKAWHYKDCGKCMKVIDAFEQAEAMFVLKNT